MKFNSLKDHHFIKYFEVNHPLCICTDDTGVFLSDLSNELLLIAEAFNLDEKHIF